MGAEQSQAAQEYNLKLRERSNVSYADGASPSAENGRKDGALYAGPRDSGDRQPIKIRRQSFTTDMLEQIPSLADYTVMSKLGEGSFGRVLMIQKNDDKALYALKIINKKDIRSQKGHQNVVNESEALQKIQHPFIMKLYAAFQDQHRFFMVFEYCPGGDLYLITQEAGMLPLGQCKVFVAEIALALDTIHASGYLYRDLKLENILIGTNGHCKLGDFGLAKKMTKGRGSMAGTTITMAPEVMDRQPYDAAADWWSLGVCFCEMHLGGSPIPQLINDDEPNDAQVTLTYLRRLLEAEGHLDRLPDGLDPQARQMIRGMLRTNPRDRLSSLDMLKAQALYESFDWEGLLALRMPSPLKDTSLDGNDVQDDYDYRSLDDRLAGAAEDLDDDGVMKIDTGATAQGGDEDDESHSYKEQKQTGRFSARKISMDRKFNFSNLPSLASTKALQAFALGSTRAAAVAPTACEVAANGDSAGLRKLVKAGGSASRQDYDMRTPLHVACAEGQLAMVKLLIEEFDVPVNAEDRWGGTPLDDADRGSYRMISAYLKTKGGVKKRRHSFLAKENGSWLSANDLCDAAHRGDEATLVRLISQQIDINEANFDQRTALHAAASEGHLDVVKAIVEQLHANVNAIDRWGTTPLDEAERFHHTKVCKYLKAKGGVKRQEAILQESMRRLDQVGSDLEALQLCHFAARGDLDGIKVLQANGANLQARDYDRRTCLHLAASENHARCVKYLMSCSVEINPKDRYGNTPLDDAERQGNHRLAALMRSQGAMNGEEVKFRLSPLVKMLRISGRKRMPSLKRNAAVPSPTSKPEASPFPQPDGTPDVPIVKSTAALIA